MRNFRLIDDGNTIDFENVGGLEGFEFPSIHTVYTDVPGRQGSFFIKSKFSRRRLSWKGVPSSAKTVDRRPLLAINIGELKTLQFETDDGLELQAMIELEQVNMPYKHGRTPYMYEAIAPDYRFYSQDLTEVSTVPTTTIGGVTLPTSLPIDFSNVTGVSNLDLVNDGNSETPPVFLITGSGTNFTIQNVTTGALLKIYTTLGPTDQITIDVLNKTILLNGGTNIFGLSDRGFWEIPIGNSELHFSVESGSDDNTLLEVSYRSAYKGI